MARCCRRSVAVQEAARLKSPPRNGAAEALLDGGRSAPNAKKTPRRYRETEIKVDREPTMSRAERLRSLDVRTDEAFGRWPRAKKMLARLSLPVKTIARAAHDLPPRVTIDAARTLRALCGAGGAKMHSLAFKTPRPPLSSIWWCFCDISGSMSQYPAWLLHFLHAVSNAKGGGMPQVHAFTFGTTVDNITRPAGHPRCGCRAEGGRAQAQDWERRFYLCN